MNSKIIRKEVTDNYRLVVISDVHADKENLIKLMDKVKLTERDHLVILGDFLNRGNNSYETYLFIKELSKRENTIILKGNHESFMQRHLSINKDSNEFLEFLQKEHYETLISELIKKSGGNVHSIESCEEMIMTIGSERLEIIDFLSTLPILAYFDDMILVHGGYNDEYTIEDNETDYLKYDFYNEVAKVNDNLVIVGHWPASELRKDKLTNAPFYNNEKKIVSIDGGIGGKLTGELNALIIEKNNGKVEHSYVQVNNFRKKLIKKHNEFIIEPLVYLNYPNEKFEVLSLGKKWSKCRQLSSGKEFRVFSSLLVNNEGDYSLKANYINNFLNLNLDEEVELCCEFEDCALVKYKDEFGWLELDQIN